MDYLLVEQPREDSPNMDDVVDDGTLAPEGTPEGTDEDLAGTQIDPKSETFIVSAGGLDEEVTLDDLLKGYMRQSDYTRKTQELANRRKAGEQADQIYEALQQNPHGTLAALADAFGVQLQSEDTDPEWDDPNAKRVRELESQLARLESALSQRDQQSAFEREVTQLLTKYGEDVDVENVVEHARQGRFPSLEAAFKDLRFDEINGATKVLTRKQQLDDVVVRAKRVAQVVNPGSTSAGEIAQVVEMPTGRKPTIDDAFFAAKEGKRFPSWEEQFFNR